MSAIVGLYYRDGRFVDHGELDALAGTLAHRGPDGAGVWQDGPVGLGHQMLRTTSESLGEHLPLVEHGGDLVITADARLDNRDELIAGLEIADGRGRDLPDSGLILLSYRKWGPDCPVRLLGDFAFAIWDRRRQQIFCARDHFGVKPFYYYLSPRAFVFATEIKAIVSRTEVPRQLNESRLGDFLVWQYAEQASTFYEGIERLLPGHYLIVKAESCTTKRYWSLDPTRELRLGSDQEYAEALRERFVDAVRRRMRTAYPIGSMLSGGIDSSSITCVARRIRSQEGDESPWPTFSAVHDIVVEADESAFIREVLAYGNYNPTYFAADNVGPLNDFERAMWYQDEVFPGGNLYVNRGIYDLAQRQGLRVMLDGFDGDTTVSHGFGYFQELARAGRWMRLGREVIPFARSVGEPWFTAFWSWIWAYKLKNRVHSTPVLRRAGPLFEALLRGAPTAESEHWLAAVNPDFARRIDLEGRRRACADGPILTEREGHYLRLTDIGQTVTLEALNRAAGAHALDIRFPFWDRRLIEFCLALPPDQKIHGGVTRMVMRRAMEGILPPAVQWRRAKTVASSGFTYGLRKVNGARVEQVVVENPHLVEDYVNLATLHRYHDRLRAGVASAAEVNALWIIVSLALWLQSSGLKN